jgi:outer membrane receptor protein involved in Fe transport
MHFPSLMNVIKYVGMLLCPIFILSPGSLYAQGILRGQVKDVSDSVAVIGAVIYDPLDKSGGTASDLNGNYELKLKPGKRMVVCSNVGMKTDTLFVTIDTAKTSTHTYYLHTTAIQLETMVVSAGKYERRLEEITVSMEVIKPSLVENKNVSNIKGVLEQVPGLNILDGEPQIRGGSGFDFGVGSRVAILIDGLPALSGDGSALAWNFIPLENVEQIEVIKGASSVTYGSSALSGSINVRTAYAKDEPVTKVAMTSGFYDAPSGPGNKWWPGMANFSNTSVLHAQRFGQLDVVIGIMAIYDHGYIGPPSYHANLGSFNDTSVSNNSVGEHTGRFNFNLRYRPKSIPGLNYGLNGNFMKSTNNISLIWDNDSSGLYRSYPHTMTLQDQTMLYLDPFVNYYSDGGWMQSLRARYAYNKNISTNNTTTDLSTETNSTYAEYQVVKKFNEALNVTAGIISNQVYSHSGLAYMGVSTNNHLQNYAGYAQADIKFWKVLNVSLGVREETFKMNDGSTQAKPVFRSGINWKMAKATFLRCSYGQGYRYPSIKESYIHSDIGGLAIFPNPQLLPESSWNAEIGIKQGFKLNNFIGYFDAAFFWQEYANTIEITYGFWDKRKDIFGNDSLSAGFKYLNTGSTRVRGFELSLPGEGKITHNLSFDILADYTYVLPQALTPNRVFAVDSSPQQMSYAFTSTDTRNNILKYRFQSIAKIDFQLTWKRWSVGGDWRYYSYMQNIDEIFYLFDSQAHYGIKAYRENHPGPVQVVDARIAMQVTKKIKVALVVNNVGNLSYSLRPLKIESPRTFALRISAKF